VLEVVEDLRGNTYRAVYTARYAVRVFDLTLVMDEIPSKLRCFRVFTV
jgi:hypothetical protein